MLAKLGGGEYAVDEDNLVYGRDWIDSDTDPDPDTERTGERKERQSGSRD